MAEISFKGFVESYSGRGPLTIVEQHRRKDESDQWVTEARTFHRVWPPKGASAPAEGSLVAVVGSQKTTKYVKDGETRYSLVVNAESIELVSTRPAPAVQPYDVEAPF